MLTINGSVQIHGVLFDLDGTLLDTEPLYEEAIGKAVEEFGAVYSWEVQKRIVGKGEHMGAQIIIDCLELEISTDELLQRRDVYLLELFKTCKLRKGAEELVNYVVKENIPFAIATSSMRKYFAIKSSSNAELFSKFQHIVCGDDIEVNNPKPFPDIYLVAASKIGIDISQCLVLEDSLAGLQSGRSAGARYVALSPDTRLNCDEFAEADLIVEEWDEFIALLG